MKNDDMTFGLWLEDRLKRSIPAWRKMTPKVRAALLLDLCHSELDAHLIPETEFDDRLYGMIDAINAIFGEGKLDPPKWVEP